MAHGRNFLQQKEYCKRESNEIVSRSFSGSPVRTI